MIKKLLSYLALVLSIFTLYACEKDKLKGDRSILVGTWTWTYSGHYTDVCSKYAHGYHVTKTSDTLGYAITMEYSGKIMFYKNDSLLNAGNIRFIDQNAGDNSFSFEISTNPYSSLTMKGFTDGKTLRLADYFPFIGE